MISNDPTESKFQILTQYIQSRKSVLVALSGGIDSMLLSLLAHRALGSNAHAVTVMSEFFIKREASFVERFIDEFHISHSFLKVSVLENERILVNPENRCYLCKRFIFEKLLGVACEKGLSVVFDGTNVDDLDEDRPGIRALHELGIVSPYVEAGIDKQDILRYASSCGLKSYIRPSNTCLATRIPAFVPLREEVLQMVDEAESFMHDHGFDMVRVRYHEPYVARIEVNNKSLFRLLQPAFKLELTAHFKSLGFNKISIDMEGIRKGDSSLNST
jgi:uncharacterized protein